MSTLLADREPFFLAGLRAALNEISTLQILWESADSRQLLEAHARHKPDLLIMGFLLACGRDALGLVSELHAAQSRMRIVVFLEPAVAWLAPRLFSAGVHGVVSRRATSTTLRAAILSVMEGGSHLDPVFLGPTSPPNSIEYQIQTTRLTVHEREVFRLIGENKSPREISSTLGISPKTISTHRENIKSKLNLMSSKSLQLAAQAAALWETCGVDCIL